VPSRVGQSGQHIGIDMAARLAIDSSCPSASILAHVFASEGQPLWMADSAVELAKPFGRFSRGEFPQMFKFTLWVPHEV
jgi:hypothetical protein